jgi:Domain of unknown function (DUF4397)
VQVANVAPGFETLAFRREQDFRTAAELQFKGTQVFTYDADTYDFFVADPTVDVTGQGRTWTFAPLLEADRNYTFVLTEVGGDVQPVVIAHSAAPATGSQIVAVHAASGLPAMDLYLESPGVGIAGATPRGSFNAQEQIAAPLPSGDYELTLTVAGNPADVLLASSTTITLAAGTASTLIVVPEAGQSTAQLSVLLLQAAPTVLYDRNVTSELRVINAATDQAPRDFAVDGQFSPPLFSAMPFGEPTPYAPIPTTSAKINVTPVGNPGVLELEQNVTATAGQRATMLFNGPAGTLVATFAADDRRRLNREAKLRYMNAASQFVAIDFVLTFPGEDPNLFSPLAQLLTPGMSSYTPTSAGEYDLYLRQFGTVTVLSGPTRINVAAGGLYSVLAVDGPDTATANVLLLDDFQ